MKSTRRPFRGDEKGRGGRHGLRRLLREGRESIPAALRAAAPIG